MGSALTAALFDCEGLAAVRYPRGSEGTRPEGYTIENLNYDIVGDKDADTLLITYGRLFNEAIEARRILQKQGKKLCILKLCRIKPIDTEAVRFAAKYPRIRFFEEGMASGGTAQLFRTMLSELSYSGEYQITAVDDRFVPHASVSSTLKSLGFDAQSMARAVQQTEEVNG
ncbi:MAG TPA: hypothetical protein DCY72_02635 [Ruminococcaceae bacterium]|nr:hypothetical protein [Oscillospiraceae bacterium]